MSMTRYLLTLTVVSFLSGCATSPPSRKGALDLHQELGRSSAVVRFPEEYRSFISVIARAEIFTERGESLQAENVYRLATLKGHLLKTRTAEPEPKVTAAVAVVPASQVAANQVNTTAPPLPVPVQQMEVKPLQVEFLPDAPPRLLLPDLPPVSPVVTTSPLPPISTQDESAQAASSPTSGDDLPRADSRRFIGNRGMYTVQKGDSLKRVGARLGVDWRQLAKNNGLDPRESLYSGQLIMYDNRKIVPSGLRDGIVINIADRTLYLLKNGTVESSYPVAVGKPPKPEDDEDWTTPTGRFIITTKAKDPVWRVPQSIQDEMEQRGREPIKEMPAGKGNPLGKYAMKTSLSGIVIHSTNLPSSIYSYASHGCVRVMPEHMEKLFPAVSPRTSGIIVYQPVKLAVSPEGRLFLEVNGDVYGRFPGSMEGEVRKLVSRRKMESRVDWNKVARLLKKKSGIPEEITRDQSYAVRPLSTARESSAGVTHPVGNGGFTPLKPTL